MIAGFASAMIPAWVVFRLLSDNRVDLTLLFILYFTCGLTVAILKSIKSRFDTYWGTILVPSLLWAVVLYTRSPEASMKSLVYHLGFSFTLVSITYLLAYIGYRLWPVVEENHSEDKEQGK